MRKYKRRERSIRTNHKTIKKMAIGTHISIITLNINGISAPTKTHRLAEWIQKSRPIYILSTGNPFQTESERMEKYIPCRWKIKESWSSNPHTRQSRPYNKEYYKR